MNKKERRMISIIRRIAVFVVLSSIIVGVAGAAAEYAEDRVFIGIDTENTSITEIVDESMIISDYGDLVSGTYLIQIPEGMTVPEAIAYYSSMENVKFVEPDNYAHIAEEKTPSSPFPAVGILAGLGISLLIAKKRDH